ARTPAVAMGSRNFGVFILEVSSLSTGQKTAVRCCGAHHTNQHPARNASVYTHLYKKVTDGAAGA
ncbi:MAG TPA: hypothetical protein VF885_25795, partial [Arthrobacter sp.]